MSEANNHTPYPAARTIKLNTMEEFLSFKYVYELSLGSVNVFKSEAVGNIMARS